MQRRDFLKIAGMAAAGSPLLERTMLGQMQMQSFLTPNASSDVAKTEFTLEIAPVTVELAPNRVISTIGYNGTSPGPLLRMKEGVPVTVNVVNKTDVPETCRTFTALLIRFRCGWIGRRRDAGCAAAWQPQLQVHANARWYTLVPHPHNVDGRSAPAAVTPECSAFWLSRVQNNPGSFDHEHYLALRDWEPYFTNQNMDTDDLDATWPEPERPKVMDTRPAGLEVAADIFSINDKALGAGEPIRVKPGERVLFHFLKRQRH